MSNNDETDPAYVRQQMSISGKSLAEFCEEHRELLAAFERFVYDALAQDPPDFRRLNHLRHFVVVTVSHYLSQVIAACQSGPHSDLTN